MDAVKSNKQLSRPAYSLWRHFPGIDQHPDQLADVTVKFQQYFDNDVVKLSPSGMYAVEDYGVTARLGKNPEGIMVRESSPYGDQSAWRNIPRVAVDDGALGVEVSTAKNIRKRIAETTPIISTIFSPLALVHKMADADAAARLLSDSALAHGVLSRVAGDVILFAQAVLKVGVDGFFLASQHASRASQQQVDLYEEYGKPYDLHVLNAVRSESEYLLLHMHGDHPYLQAAQDYPVDVVNWDDHGAAPTLVDATREQGHAVSGGIPRALEAAAADPVAFVTQLGVHAASVRDHGLLLGPGCVLPIASPWSALRDALHLLGEEEPSTDGKAAETAAPPAFLLTPG